jgi:hypothetical protein
VIEMNGQGVLDVGRSERPRFDFSRAPKFCCYHARGRGF